MSKRKITVLWRIIKKELEEEIKDASFGDRFYTIDEICEKYKVSRITAQRVLRELRNEGFLDTGSGRANVIRRINKDINIYLIIPSTFSDKSLTMNPIVKIHSGIIDEAKELKVNIDYLSEQYLPWRISNIRDKNKSIGFIFLGRGVEKTKEIVRKYNIPFVVFADSEVETEDFSVGIDKRYGAYITVKHLISLGHRRIGFITGPVESIHYFPRYEGYKKAIEKNGIEYDSALIEETTGKNIEEDIRAFEKLINLTHPPTAIFTANDWRGIHILEYCNKKGIKIPEEISIAGFDNIRESLYTTPPLTTVETHRKETGKEAVKMLVYLLSGRGNGLIPKRRIIFKPELVIRKSTGMLRELLKERRE
ncbi:MAG: substrate-binding domain-containing protein [Candidatus Omnitrophica bacterium]|nr:substrate-binding domain-containing protein [Candidatus Omnitrophota bacterium]